MTKKNTVITTLGTRDFKEDLGAVLCMNYPGGIASLRFPLGLTDEMLETSILNAKFPKRAENSLLRNNVTTIGDLLNRLGEIKSFRGCGETTAVMIKNCFMQFYYNSLSDKKVKEFWEEFLELNNMKTIAG